jgi:hypothetical protein
MRTADIDATRSARAERTRLAVMAVAEGITVASWLQRAVLKELGLAPDAITPICAYR